MKPRAREWVPFTLFTLFWLVPVAYVGLMHRGVPNAGRLLNNQYNVGCLFIQGPLAWDTFFVQYREVGSTEWKDQPPEELSTMHPFGHSTRFDMLLGRSMTFEGGVLQRQQMAEFARRRHAELHPDAPPVESVRFIDAYELSAHYKFPKGSWQRKSLEEFPDAYRDVLSTHYFDGRLPMDINVGQVDDKKLVDLGRCIED